MGQTGRGIGQLPDRDEPHRKDKHAGKDHHNPEEDKKLAQVRTHTGAHNHQRESEHDEEKAEACQCIPQRIPVSSGSTLA